MSSKTFVEEDEILETIKKKCGESKSAIKLVLKEYARIFARELLKGNKVELPNKFGSVEIITRKATAKDIERSKEKNGTPLEYFNKTGFAFNVPGTAKYKMKIYAVGNVVERFKYILSNKLKKYRYVD